LVRASQEVIDFGWRSNLVVDRCHDLLAAFLGGVNSRGVRSISVGRGVPEWDEQPPPPPARRDTQLVDPNPFVIRVRPADMVFLDPDGEPTPGPTSRLRIRVTLPPGRPPVPQGESVYPMREFGLFGSVGNQAFMINSVRHPVVLKAAGDTLERTIELTL